MSQLLSNRVALVTGAGRGIGRACSVAFAKEGAKVALCARSQAELDEVAAEITAAGGQALVLAADLSAQGVPGEVISKIKETWGPVQILFNNAGIGSSSNPKPVVDFDDDFWELTLKINLTAPYHLCKLVLPDMLAAGTGRIINLASINGKVGSFHGAAYAASKHGLLGLTRTLAMEVASQGITVNAICPGPVHTLMNDKRIQYDAERLGKSFEQQETSVTPIGRRLEPEEIAPLAVYLASDGAASVTGQAINIDGGVLMTG